MTQTIFHNFDDAPTHVAPFSHAVECDGWIQLTGQMQSAGLVFFGAALGHTHRVTGGSARGRAPSQQGGDAAALLRPALHRCTIHRDDLHDCALLAYT